MQLLDSIQPKLNSLVSDYLNQTGHAIDLASYAPSMDGLKDAHANRSARSFDRKTLVEVLSEQADRSEFTAALTAQQIDTLLKDETVTVTTGHQLCVYGGPMFFFYKILSTIQLCQQLKEVGIHAVPVYWMASEDHDFEEINHVFLGDQKVNWNNDEKGAVGAMHLSTMAEFKIQLASLFNNDYRYEETLKTLSHIFDSERVLKDALRDFVYWVFADSGVVVLDADDNRLKQIFSPVVEKELDQGFSEKLLLEQSASMKSHGYPVQVAGREINLFWMKNGYRERIVRTESGFATADGANNWDVEGLANALKTNPEAFSPNVILRPLYQECILPNIAYIGGPGETSYWLQLKSVFESVGVTLPVILLRDMFALVSDSTDKKRRKLGLTFESLSTERDALIRALVEAEGTHEHVVDAASDQVQKSFENLFDQLKEFDLTLVESAKAEEARALKRFARLKKKVYRSDKRRNEVLIHRLDAVLEDLYPYDTPQERIQNWLHFFTDPKEVLDLLSWCDPLKKELKFVRLGE